MFITMDKLPIFPHSKTLDINDKPAIESFVAKHPPYSDFNFTSMFSWDSRNEYRVSNLNNNLVVRFTDYITGEPFYSCLGENKIDETLQRLIKQSELEGITPRLQLIPRNAVNNLKNVKLFRIKEDIDNFDYIYSLPSSVELKGKKYQNHRTGKRNFLEKFDRRISVRTINPSNQTVRKKMLDLFNTWSANTSQPQEDIDNEMEAIIKILNYSSDLNIFCIAIYIEDELVAFSINELVDEDYAITHFEKANISYSGIYYFIRHETSKLLLKKGRRLLNLEQDLGIESLRYSKKAHRPIDFLKKYTVELS